MKHVKTKIIATGAVLLLLSGCTNDTKTTPANTASDTSNKTSSDTTKNAISQSIDNAKDTKQTIENNATKTMETSNQSTDTTQSATNTTSMEYVNKYDSAIIHTSAGDITVKFYGDVSPKTVENFLKLSSEKFYDGTRFHRVIKGFMIQGGDPNSKDADWSNDGIGGPGYKFPDEFNKHPLVKGSLAMANSGPNTNGSQFFIVTAESTPWLDGKHTNFGEVTSGMDIITAIENAEVNGNDHPLKDITVKSIDLVAKK